VSLSRSLSRPYVYLFSQIDEADVFKETKQFTYKDGSQFVFMDLVLLSILILQYVFTIVFFLFKIKKERKGYKYFLFFFLLEFVLSIKCSLCGMTS
jgi:hypothetical protein